MQVGSLVECIFDSWQGVMPGNLVPVKGNIYTIREIIEDDGVFLRLEEIVNPNMFYSQTREYTEAMFNSDAFVEIQPPMSIEFLMKECKTNLV